MTNEERNLLTKDLCARLPYGVVVHFDGWNPEKLTQIDLRELVFNDMGGIPKPYLRPLGSMTDEEREEFRLLGGVMSYNPVHNIYAMAAFSADAYDWLNKNHFDYRGMIEKGLAITAKEGMYSN